MADKKISDLDDGSAVVSGDLVEVERPGDPAASYHVPLDSAAGRPASDFADAGDLADHIADAANPHGVTKAQIGLGNVSNDAQLKESTFTTRGDLIVRGASASQRLARGGANTVLTSDGTDPNWAQLAYAMIASGAIASASDILSGTASKLLAAANLKSAIAFQTLSDASSIAWDFSAGNDAAVTLGGNRTGSNITNALPGAGFILKLTASGATRSWTPGNQFFPVAGIESFPVSVATTETVYVVGFIDTTTRFVITGVLRT